MKGANTGSNGPVQHHKRSILQASTPLATHWIKLA